MIRAISEVPVGQFFDESKTGEKLGKVILFLKIFYRQPMKSNFYYFVNTKNLNKNKNLLGHVLPLHRQLNSAGQKELFKGGVDPITGAMDKYHGAPAVEDGGVGAGVKVFGGFTCLRDRHLPVAGGRGKTVKPAVPS